MFEKISNIRDFGVYKNYVGNNISNFKRFNLIYGWNYSGKTTLSRLFRCFEKQELHSDYPNAKFSIVHSDGYVCTEEFQKPCVVRVFNDDFKKENLFWDDADGFNPILLLGAENIEKRKILQEKIAAHQLSDQSLTAVVTAKESLIAKISKSESDCATRIVNELGIGRFDRRHLKPIIEAWDGTLPAPLSNDLFQIERGKISSEQKDILQNVVFNTSLLEDAWNNAIIVLNERIDTAVTIQRYVEKPDIGNWAEKGIHLHVKGGSCEFCGNEITNERWAALSAHFSDAFESHLRRIDDAVLRLSNGILSINDTDHSTSAFYADLQPTQKVLKGRLAALVKEINSDVQKLVGKLNQKKLKPFEAVDPPDQKLNLEMFTATVAEFQSLIDTNNNRTRDFASQRNAAIEVLKSHYVAEAMREIDRFSLITAIEQYEEDEIRIAAESDKLKIEISQLQTELSSANNGAETINVALRRFFGKSDIQIVVTENNRFLLKRGTAIAKNLSEGERTAIAFCYFVTKLIENGNDLKQTIVYIDDPISSLDSHHLIHINAFIKNAFYRFDQNGNPKHICLAKQLFISTHNSEFFHLTWSWMNHLKNNDKSAFLIERTDTDNSISSRIIDCPEAILKYRSEYLFLFQQLIHFKENPSSDPQIIFNVGNMARRFVEGYLSFKFFEHTNVDSSLSQLITDPVDCERARNFMHYYSHTLSRSGGMYLPDMSDAVNIIEIILKSIRVHDPIHYDALTSVP